MRILVVTLVLILISISCTKMPSDQLVLFDPDVAMPELVTSDNPDEISFQDEQLLVSFATGSGYSTVSLYPESDNWDASGYRFVKCEIDKFPKGLR